MTFDTFLLAVLLPALLLAIGWLMPGLTPPTVPFAVRVPPERVDEPVIVRHRNAYRWWVAVAGSALLALSVVLSTLGEIGIVSWVVPAALLLVLLPGYLRARYAIRSAKRREEWYRGLRQAVVADTSLRTQPEPFPWLWTAPAVLILVITAIVGIIRYPAMPATLVLHYNVHGVPDRTGTKTVFNAFSIVFVQACTTALILLLARWSLRSRPGVDASAPGATALKHRTFVSRMTRALLALAAFTNLSMLAAAWQIWTNTPSITLAVLPVIAGVVVMLGVSVRTGQSGSRVRVDGEGENTGVVQRDDDRFWHGAGNIYVNRDDPALLVPKRFGIGWTVNFGNPRALALLVVPVAILVTVRLLMQ
jgi:uncharacterized membrane protein